jgi:electron transfer flavoprotein beta subunit
MDIIVCVKHVVDTTEVRIKQENNELILRGVPTKISDYDKNAIEEAVKIKEKTKGKITLLTIGPKEAVKSLKEGLAMGADQAILITEKGLEDLEPLRIAKLLASSIKKIGSYSLVLCGSVSEDGYNAQVGPILAELLGLPHVAYAEKIKIESEGVLIERFLEDKIEKVKGELPLLITLDRKINTPRLPTAIQVMKVPANKIITWKLADTGIATEVIAQEKIKFMGYKVASVNRKNKLLQGEKEDVIAELINSLENEGVM